MRNNPSAVMIFAAGFGTRMGDLTKDRPKPLVEVAGRPLIDHALEWVEAFGPDRVAVNMHYKAEMLRQHLANWGVLFSEEQPDILDTGGGLKAALPLLGDCSVFTMNSDAVWAGPNPLQHLLRSWDPDKMDALLLCIPVEAAVGYAGEDDYLIGSDGQLTRESGQVYSGLQIIKTKPVLDVEDRIFSLREVWRRLQSQGRLSRATYPGHWCDVGHPEGITLAENMLGGRDV